MTLADLVGDLKFNSQVQTSEGYADPADYERVIKGAGLKHNSSYVITSTECTVPDVERAVLGMLANSDFCLVRAAKVANSPTLTAPAGFGTDRNTPFYKLMALAKALLQQYEDACKALGLDNYYGSVQGSASTATSETVVISADHGGLIPTEISPVPAAPKLECSPVNAVSPDGTIILSWNFINHTNFSAYRIFHMTGDAPIFQNWNFGSKVGTPKINDLAEVVGSINEIDCKSVMLTDLPIDVGTVNRFLVVIATKSARYAYSNELALTQP